MNKFYISAITAMMVSSLSMQGFVPTVGRAGRTVKNTVNATRATAHSTHTNKLEQAQKDADRAHKDAEKKAQAAKRLEDKEAKRENNRSTIKYLKEEITAINKSIEQNNKNAINDKVEYYTAFESLYKTLSNSRIARFLPKDTLSRLQEIEASLNTRGYSEKFNNNLIEGNEKRLILLNQIREIKKS